MDSIAEIKSITTITAVITRADGTIEEIEFTQSPEDTSDSLEQ
jgi:hypothetical protein